MDYYEILGVSRDASQSDIKKAYRSLSKKYHPDKHKGEKKAEEKYKQINRAYECLSDSRKKQSYDQFGSEDSPQFGGGGHPFGGQGTHFGGGFEGFGDIFETFFGGGRGGQRTSANRHGRDAEVVVHISLKEAYTGVTKNIRIKKFVSCKTCSGTGSKNGSKNVSCTACGGAGQVVKTAQSFFGAIRQNVICDACKGVGRVPESPCTTCNGEGRAHGSEEVTVEIPQGISSGQTLRVSGKGEIGRWGAKAGDLYVHVEVATDAHLVRNGDDIRTSVSIDVPDAALGTQIQVKTVSENVILKIPAGTQPGQILRVRGKGMPVLNTARHGDLYVEVSVEVPKKLGKKEKKLWEGLRK